MGRGRRSMNELYEDAPGWLNRQKAITMVLKEHHVSKGAKDRLMGQAQRQIALCIQPKRQEGAGRGTA